jgi:hypothetical protein
MHSGLNQPPRIGLALAAIFPAEGGGWQWQDDLPDTFEPELRAALEASISFA